MQLVLDISTSAEFWRRIYPLDRAPRSSWAAAPTDCAYLEEDVWSLAPSWIDEELLARLDGKLHVLAFDRSLRRTTGSHVVHTWSYPVPEGSFHKLGPDVLVMSPCFMFLMAASVLPLRKLIAFGDELCGFYGFDEREKRGFRKRKVPLITREMLEAYLRGAKTCKGLDRALMALPHIVNKSASPMETFDEMAMCLPYRLGGYGLPKFEMNHEVPLSEQAARIARRNPCYADMCRPEVKLDVEHHGKHDHSTPEDVEADYARKNALREMGYEVIELTWKQVSDLEAFEVIVLRIAKKLGKRIYKSKLGYLPERMAFRSEVLDWNRSSGRIR